VGQSQGATVRTRFLR